MRNVLQVSQRALSLPSSPIRKLVPYGLEAEKRGIKVYHLNIGDPDFATPQLIRSDLKKVATSIKTISYSNSCGLKEHVDAWVQYYSQIGININSEEVLVTNGGSEALLLALAMVLDPRDNVLIFEPFYANDQGFVNFLSGKIKTVPLDIKNSFHLPLVSKIEKAISPKTRAILFANPNNPTGTVYTKDELNTLLYLAKKYNLFLISDETYRGICFDGKKSFSLLQITKGREAERIIICDSLSKRLNIPGARLGALISQNRQIMKPAICFAQSRLSVGTVEQMATTNMLSDCVGYIKTLAGQYQKRRDVFLDTLEEKLNLKITRPEGAFYTMVKLPIKDTDKFAQWLLTDFSDRNETVMVTPGAGFYATPKKGKNEIRVAFVINEKDLKRSAELLGLAVKRYLDR